MGARRSHDPQFSLVPVLRPSAYRPRPAVRHRRRLKTRIEYGTAKATKTKVPPIQNAASQNRHTDYFCFLAACSFWSSAFHLDRSASTSDSIAV